MDIEQQGIETARRAGLPRLWTVFASYRVRDGLVEPASRETTRFYAPAAHSELLNAFSRLHDGTEEDILRFVGSYGLLGFWELTARNAQEPRRPGDPLRWIIQHAHTIRLVMDLWRLLQDGDEVELRRALAELSRPVTTVEFAAGPLVKRQPFLLGTVLRGPAPFALARDIVRTILNDNLAGIGPTLSERDQCLRLSFSFRALIDILYYQLATAVTGGRLQRCAAQGCSGLFVQHDPRQRFCPPWFDQKGESLCSLRERQRTWRVRKSQQLTHTKKPRQPRRMTKKGARA